jgi:Uma2 family endonuclease
MSTVNRPQTRSCPPLEDGQRLDQPTFHERYAAMPERTRAELIGGVVFMPSPLRDAHGETDRLVGGWLFLYQSFTPGLRSPSNATTILGADIEVQPDAQLRISEELGGQARVVDDYVNGPPELVVEIARSSRSNDLGPKKDEYEKAGVLEYLFVGIEPNQIRLFVLRDGVYQEMVAGEDGIYRSEVFPGLWLDPKALFKEDRPGLIAALYRGLATDDHAQFVADLRVRGA